MKYRIVLFFILIFFFLSAENYVPGQVIVQLEGSKQDQTSAISHIQKDLASLQITKVSLLSARMGAWLFEFDGSSHSVEAAIREFNLHPLIKISQPNHYVEERETYPDDPYFENQWADQIGKSSGSP